MSDTTMKKIELPDWAVRLCAVLNGKATKGELEKRIETGEVKPGDSLQFDLGISPNELASLAHDINTLVIDVVKEAPPRKYLTTLELYACKTVVDVMNLVFSRV